MQNTNHDLSLPILEKELKALREYNRSPNQFGKVSEAGLIEAIENKQGKLF
jgi:hypothetical protein